MTLSMYRSYLSIGAIIIDSDVFNMLFFTHINPHNNVKLTVF